MKFEILGAIKVAASKGYIRQAGQMGHNKKKDGNFPENLPSNFRAALQTEHTQAIQRYCNRWQLETLRQTQAVFVLDFGYSNC